MFTGKQTQTPRPLYRSCAAGLVLGLFLAFGAPGPVSAQILTGYRAQTAQNAPVTPPVQAAKTSSSTTEISEDPVDLQADRLIHNEDTQVITASGNVMMEQSGRLLRADEISYNLKTDTVSAHGNVVLNEVNGDIHYSDEVEFNDKLKNGFIKGLQTFLNDGSRFTAKEGTREGGTVTTMHDATYTPCEPCKKDPERAPVWQIRASEVVHNEQEHSISYKNARFEVFGVPVAYTPYFAHPDGTIKRKSGVLPPSAGYKSELGAFVESSYYWNIAPDKDATLGIIAMTEEVPLLFGQYRQRWTEASVEIEGGITHSERTESKGGVDVKQQEELRGHVFAEGLWNINDKWRSGLDVAWASDDQYMRQYDFTNENVLDNELYVERFSGRNYAVGRVLAFQDIRIPEEGEQLEDQPEVLPEIIVNFKGEPNSMPVLGGRWSADASVLGLRRGGDDQDMNRLSGAVGWNRRLVSDYGLLTTVDAQVRGDFYNTRDRDIATAGSGRSTDSTGARLYPNIHVQSSYPVVKDFEKMQATIEPIIAVTASPNIDVNNDIPNEDSQDVQIDASNLFEPNRFPGYDRVEDQSRVTYGIRTGLYGHGGSYADVFLGQSHRFDNDDNPFPEGSGLDRQESDVVGQVSTLYDDRYSLNYRFQLSSNDLSSQRHEVDSSARFDRLSLNTNYLFAKELEGTDIDSSREQIQGSAAYHVSEDWRIRTGATQDLGDDPGLRRAFVGLDYFGQCVSWSLLGRRNLTRDSSGDSDTEILFRIGLKNLGEYQASGLRLPGTSE